MCSFRPSKIIKPDLLHQQTVCSFNFSPLAETIDMSARPEAGDGFIPLQICDCTHPEDGAALSASQEAPSPGGTPASEGADISVDELKQQLGDAFRRGLEEGRQQAERGLSNVFKALRDGIAEVNELREKVLRESEEDLLKLSIMVARKIIQREIRLDTGILAGVITTAVDALSDLERVTIRLNPEDYAQVSSNRERYLSGIGQNGQVTLAADDQLLRGGCMVDTPTGTIDARIETQLDEIFNRFMEERGTPVDIISGVSEEGEADADT